MVVASQPGDRLPPTGSVLHADNIRCATLADGSLDIRFSVLGVQMQLSAPETNLAVVDYVDPVRPRRDPHRRDRQPPAVPVTRQVAQTEHW